MDKEEQKESEAKVRGLFPSCSLMNALRISTSIKTNNNLHPYNRLDVAASLNYSPNSSGFRMLIIASNSYGLTKGSYIAEKLALTDLGKKIVAPTSDSEKNASLKEALFNIPLFKQVFTKFDQGQLPRKELLLNTLNREHNIPLDKCEAAYNVLIKNARELGVLKNQKGTDYIRLDLLSQDAPTAGVKEDESPDAGDASQDSEIEDSDDKVSMSGAERTQGNVNPKIFISHSKNKKILNQIKQILEFGQFEAVVAEEMETTAIPISQKIFGLMKQCNCAIINLSVDNPENDSVTLNENVLIEIGAAFLQYNKKVILLVDKRIAGKLPSNLHGVYRCEYQGDELSFDTAMKLQKALGEFRKE